MSSEQSFVDYVLDQAGLGDRLVGRKIVRGVWLSPGRKIHRHGL